MCQKIKKNLSVSVKNNFWSMVIIITLVFGIGLVVFRSLLLGLSTHLLDWNDYPYYAWTLWQNIHHFKNLSFEGFFNTNAFYPLQGSLLFSDILLPQSLIALVLSWLVAPYSQQPVLIFNLTFLTGVLLNIVSAAVLSQQLFRFKLVRFLATLSLSLSPFFFLQLGHLQMITFWPVFLGLSLLLKSRSDLNLKIAILIGFLAGIEFFASVYLAFFLLAMIGFFYLAKIQAQTNKFVAVKKSLIELGIILLVFGVLAGPVIVKYKFVQKSYSVGFEYQEYTYYAAHLTDYLFFLPNTLAAKLYAPWNKFNLHLSGEPIKNPSLALSILALMGIFGFSKSRVKFSLQIKRSMPEFFFLLLVLAGFLFSLGPRLSVNGQFVNIPLPYHLLVKTLPIMEPIRATNRWYFVFYLGIWFFAMQALDKLKLKKFGKILLILGFIFFYIAEVLPTSLMAKAKDYYSDSYLPLDQSCEQQPQVLLEFPLTPVKKGVGLIEYLQYRTSQLLASVHHGCLLVNGYSGLMPRELSAYDNLLFTAVQTDDLEEFVNLLNEKEVSLIKFNFDFYEDELASEVKTWLSDSRYFVVLDQDKSSIVARVI